MCYHTHTNTEQSREYGQYMHIDTDNLYVCTGRYSGTYVLCAHTYSTSRNGFATKKRKIFENVFYLK